MGNSRKFKSSTGAPVRVVTEVQDVTLVGTDWTVLPERFHRAAYAAGCISEDMIQNTLEERVNPNIVSTLNRVATKKDKIRTTILTFLENNELDHFYRPNRGGDWKPKAQVITSLIGERVSKHERDEVWYKLLEEGIDLPEFE